nr:complement inhibitory receptor [Hymenolepis microstoma]
MYLHVRTGTIVLGVLHILIQLVVVSTLLMAALKHDVASIKSPFGQSITANCQPQTPPRDVFYMLMHIVPGFTIFHQSHADFARRFQTANFTQRATFEATPEDPKTDNLLKALIGDTNEQSKDESKKVVIEQEPGATQKDEATPLPPHKSDILTNFAPRAPELLKCFERRSNTYFSLCLALISLAFGYLLVHGVISRQPAHLLPFFCLQVFDFVVALICMLGYMSSASDISHWLRMKIADQEGVSASSIHLNSTSVSLILISASCLILAFKAYCVGMVWDCHRYLLITNRHGGILPPPSVSANFIPRFAAFAPFFGRRRGPLLLIHRRGRDSGDNSGDLPDLSTFDGTHAGVFVDAIPTEPPKDSGLPKYEEALSIPANAFAPPPYFAAKSSPVDTGVTMPPIPTSIKEDPKQNAENNSPGTTNTAFKPDFNERKRSNDSSDDPSIV